MRNTKMTCRYEELPFLGAITRENFVKDKAVFSAFSNAYGDGFLEKYDSQAKIVNGLVGPGLITGEMKAITSRIEQHYSTLRDIVNRAERYAELAGKTMKIKPADFGFKALRKEMNRKNDEAVVKILNDLLNIVDANLSALEAKGFTGEFRQEIRTFIDTFKADSLAQTSKLDERKKLVDMNAGEFDTFWNIISDIFETGKVIFKAKDKARVKDYTYAEMIKKVRMTRKKTEKEG